MENNDTQFSQNGRNRGKSSEDDGLFGPLKELNKLKEGLVDMHYLLNRSYPARSTLALVGNRYHLRTRQLLALQGMSCSQQEVEDRKQKELNGTAIKGKTIYLDGFNVLILLETLLSGGFIFKGLDGCYRDISSVHGSYKKVKQTDEVLLLIGEIFKKLNAERVVWIFDTPVSNSGRLKTLCYDIAERYGFVWDIYLENSPDKFLVEENRIICSSDAWVLNGCYQWFNAGDYIIDNLKEQGVEFNIIDVTI